MRIMMKVSIPVEAGNHAVKSKKLGQTIRSILAEQKPEAVYFGTENGERTAFIFLNLQDGAEIPKLAEPWFLAFNASVDLQPVMIPEDLAKAEPAIKYSAKRYG